MAHADANRRPPSGVDLRPNEQLELFAELDLRLPVGRWPADSQMFGPSDAALLAGMLRRIKPRRVLEIGSGHSTAVMLDVRDEGVDFEIECVEPYADRLRASLRPGDDLVLHESAVQALDPQDLAQKVGPGDVLFIDSTHVVKAGSDVGHLVLHTLPLLRPGVVVHIHDMLWPFEYPSDWLAEGRQWNEAYLLQAFLAFNTSWQIEVFGSWLWEHHRDEVPTELRGHDPGSLWIRRVA